MQKSSEIEGATERAKSPCQTASGGAPAAPGAWKLCWGGDKADGAEEGPCESEP